MGTHRYASLEELNNVIDSLPQEVKDPYAQQALGAKELPEGEGWELVSPDEHDSAISRINSKVPPKHVLLAEANRQRNEALDAGIEFEGRLYQTRARDRENLALVGQAAVLAITQGGAEPKDATWGREGGKEFKWIAADNSRVALDAQTMARLSESVAVRQSQIMVATRDVKDQINAGQITQLDQIGPALDERFP